MPINLPSGCGGAGCPAASQRRCSPAGSFTVSACTKHSLKCLSGELLQIGMLSYECDSILVGISLTLFSFRSDCVIAGIWPAGLETKPGLTFRRWLRKLCAFTLFFLVRVEELLLVMFSMY